MIVPASDWRRPHPARQHEIQESGVEESWRCSYGYSLCKQEQSVRERLRRTCASRPGQVIDTDTARVSRVPQRVGEGRRGGGRCGQRRGTRCAGSSYRRCAWGAECIPRIGEKTERWAMERTAPPLTVTQVRGPGDDRVPPAVPRARDGGPVRRLLRLETAQELEQRRADCGHVACEDLGRGVFC